MPEKKSVTFSAGAWHDRDPEEARILKMHLGHKVSIQSVYKSLANARYLDAVLLECQDCCEVLLWYQEADDVHVVEEADDVHTVKVKGTKVKIAKSAFSDDETEYVLNTNWKQSDYDDVVTRRGYLRN